MFSKLTGKWASVATFAAIFVVGGLAFTHVITASLADTILIALGIHASVSDSSVKPA